MPIVSILLFFTTFSLLIGVGLYIYFTLHNKRIRIVTEKFIRQVSELNPIVFQNIKISYSETGGQKKQLYINNRCNLYLFNNSLAIVRKQDFIFNVLFAPIVLTSDIVTTKQVFYYLDTYKPNQLIFKQTLKGEIDIKLTDPTYKHYVTEITLQGLTNEQLIQLDRIKNWC